MIMKYMLYAGIIVGVSGCLGAGAESTLKFDGEGNGAHSETPKCDDQGKIKGSGNIPDGEVQVTLQDADGAELFQQTFKGDFSLDQKTVTGASGTWNVEAQRSGDDLAGDPFSGKYTFYVTC